MALTGLFFRSRSTRTAATLIFYTAAAAQAGKEAASGASKPERRLELFRRFKGDAWSAFFRLQGQLQRDLVSFPSPLGRLVRGRWEARKAEQAVQDSERRMGQLAERMRRLTGEVEKDQPELTQFLKESEAEIEELDGESGKPVR
jgi:hypothetical protein